MDEAQSSTVLRAVLASLYLKSYPFHPVQAQLEFLTCEKMTKLYGSARVWVQVFMA